jgi:hypothetical protein
MSDALEDVMAYSQAHKRVCPAPQQWNHLWQMLPDKSRQGFGWNPPLPLILAARWETSDEEKR